MITIIGYICAVLWIMIKVIVTMILFVFLIYKGSSISLIAHPPWYDGIIEIPKAFKRNGIPGIINVIVYDLLRMFIVCTIIFIIVSTIHTLLTTGFQPIDLLHVLLTALSCGVTLVIWLFCFLIGLIIKKMKSSKIT